MDVQIKFTLEVISYHMRSWWIMADDNWSAKTYSIQFQAKETSNQSNCVVTTLSNGDLTLTKWSFSAPIHQCHSFARSLSPSHSPHLTSPQFNATSTQRNSINHSISLFTYSRTYWFRSSLIDSHTSSFSHSLSWFHTSASSLDCSRISSLTHWLTRPLIPSPKKSLAHSIIHTFT